MWKVKKYFGYAFYKFNFTILLQQVSKHVIQQNKHCIHNQQPKTLIDFNDV